MTPRKATFLVSMLTCFILLLAGCISGASEPPATATAQAVRIQALATQMGAAAQATGLVTQQLPPTEVVSQQQATEAAAQQQATQAAASALLKEAAAWPLVITDTFDDNHNNWSTGLKNGSYSTETISINDGKYNWSATAKDSFVYWTTPMTDTITDFYLAADAQQASGPSDGEVSLVFHESDDSNLYLFEVNNERMFFLSQLVNGDWQTRIDWTESEVIKPYEPNHLEVIGTSGTYFLFINGSLVGNYTESSPTEGSPGIAVVLYNKGDTGEFIFDNFELRVP